MNLHMVWKLYQEVLGPKMLTHYSVNFVLLLEKKVRKQQQQHHHLPKKQRSQKILSSIL